MGGLVFVFVLGEGGWGGGTLARDEAAWQAECLGCFFFFLVFRFGLGGGRDDNIDGAAVEMAIEGKSLLVLGLGRRERRSLRARRRDGRARHGGAAERRTRAHLFSRACKD